MRNRMNRHLFFVVAASFVFVTTAEAAEFKSLAARNAQRDYRNAIAKAEAEFEAAKEAARAEYAAALKKAQDAATKAADLDDALAIRAERERVEGGGSQATGANSEIKLLSAVWGDRIQLDAVQTRMKENSRGWSITTKGIQRWKSRSGPGLMVYYEIGGKKQYRFLSDPNDILYRP